MVETDSRPFDELIKARNKRVMIELKNNKQVAGVLKSFDSHVNVYLEDAEELENGEVKRKLGSTFLRGDTIILILPE